MLGHCGHARSHIVLLAPSVSIPAFSLSSLKTPLFFRRNPLASALHHCSIYLRLPFDHYAPLATTGMRGAKAGVSPPRRGSPCSKYDSTKCSCTRYTSFTAVTILRPPCFTALEPQSRFGDKLLDIFDWFVPKTGLRFKKG